MNIGLFGGTFNPIHNGHIEIIKYVKKAFTLEKIYFIPSATPPHKPDINLATAKERFNMVKESLEHYDDLFASDKELAREGPSFTIDTINQFKKEHGRDTDFYLVVGSDAFLDISTWKRKDQIFETVPIIIMMRGKWQNYNTIASFIEKNISENYVFSKKNRCFRHKTKQKIWVCNVPRIDISSTIIRELVKKKESVKEMVPENVEKIIKAKELYR